jgi:DNA-binding LytR/AlgR family response regulator
MDDFRIVIVEDEPATSRNLAHVLQQVDDRINVVATLVSVKESVPWFKANRDHFDLVFMDIRLADGMSFDIFNQAEILKPVVFVTAYNDYALKAFKTNAIDYILKPFDEQEIANALQKYRLLTGRQERAAEPSYVGVEQLLQQLSHITKPYKKSFLVHFREKLIPVETAKMAWFYTSRETVYAHMADGKQYVMDFTLEQLEQQLDPQQFFRANRQFIINRNYITEVDFYFNGRLLIKINPVPPEHILVSKARVPEFKSWMNS